MEANINIFLDESGEAAGYKQGSPKTFNIAILCIEDTKPLKHVMKKFQAKLYKAGWPRLIELKASRLFKARFDQSIPQTFKFKTDTRPLLKEILRKLVSLKVEIDYLTVNKAKINDQLRTAPYGILYNYYSGQLLLPRFQKHKDICLFVDARNKEQQPKLKFDGYIQTKAYSEIKSTFNLSIIHVDPSEINYGLRAVDYISWAIFRKFESDDSQFYELIRSKIVGKQEWHYNYK